MGCTGSIEKHPGKQFLMTKPKLHIIKIGGNVIDDQELLVSFLKSFAKLKGPKILVHGGGKIAAWRAAGEDEAGGGDGAAGAFQDIG